MSFALPICARRTTSQRVTIRIANFLIAMQILVDFGWSAEPQQLSDSHVDSEDSDDLPRSVGVPNVQKTKPPSEAASPITISTQQGKQSTNRRLVDFTPDSQYLVVHWARKVNEVIACEGWENQTRVERRVKDLRYVATAYPHLMIFHDRNRNAVVGLDPSKPNAEPKQLLDKLFSLPMVTSATSRPEIALVARTQSQGRNVDRLWTINTDSTERTMLGEIEAGQGSVMRHLFAYANNDRLIFWLYETEIRAVDLQTSRVVATCQLPDDVVNVPFAGIRGFDASGNEPVFWLATRNYEVIEGELSGGTIALKPIGLPDMTGPDDIRSAQSPLPHGRLGRHLTYRPSNRYLRVAACNRDQWLVVNTFDPSLHSPYRSPVSILERKSGLSIISLPCQPVVGPHTWRTVAIAEARGLIAVVESDGNISVRDYKSITIERAKRLEEKQRWEQQARAARRKRQADNFFRSLGRDYAYFTLIRIYATRLAGLGMARLFRIASR